MYDCHSLLLVLSIPTSAPSVCVCPICPPPDAVLRGIGGFQKADNNASLELTSFTNFDGTPHEGRTSGVIFSRGLSPLHRCSRLAC